MFQASNPVTCPMLAHQEDRAHVQKAPRPRKHIQNKQVRPMLTENRVMGENSPALIMNGFAVFTRTGKTFLRNVKA